MLIMDSTSPVEKHYETTHDTTLNEDTESRNRSKSENVTKRVLKKKTLTSLTYEERQKRYKEIYDKLDEEPRKKRQVIIPEGQVNHISKNM